jgi:hypothetical protein
MARHRVPDLLLRTLDLHILRTLQTCSPHGWAMSERIQQISQDLEHQGWIEEERAVSDLARGPSTPGARHPAAGNWPWKPASGNACPRPWGAS